MIRQFMMEDRYLVLRTKAGDTEALRGIYDKYRDDLLILAIALLNDKAGAEDVLHDVFISFVGHLKTFKANGSLKGYLATCVANRARNINRAKQTRAIEFNDSEPVSLDSDEPCQSLICNEQLEQLSAALAQLPYEQREVIMLHHQGGLRLKTIAGQQGLSVNTVKSRYRYGIEKLRSILKSEVHNETDR
ncbi:MAG: RNA polymerase sigma factor [Planctomycetota bacterium]